MFAWLGKIVAARWAFFVGGWLILAIGLSLSAPAWTSVIKSGEFEFLPTNIASRHGEQLFHEAFPNDLFNSSVVVVLYRENEKLRDADRQFLAEQVAPPLRDLHIPPPSNPHHKIRWLRRRSKTQAKEMSIISQVRTAADKGMQSLLTSPDGQAELAVVGLNIDFLGYETVPVVGRIKDIVGKLQEQPAWPKGLQVAVTGSAAVGRDVNVAQKQGADATQFWTIALVVILLLAIYRAPLLTLVPLITLYAAFRVCLSLLAIGARGLQIDLFEGLDIYTMVVAFGVGVDYTLFLISRYREALSLGRNHAEAIEAAIGNVGTAIAASAGTGILGIGMMAFATFGKLQQAGVAIAFSLFVMLCAALTLTPSLLRLGGEWIFWPQRPARPTLGCPDPTLPCIDGRQPAAADVGFFDRFWMHAGGWVEARPATIWLVAIAILTPFAVLAVRNYNRLDYGLISQLPANEPSVLGTAVVTRHFSVGETGPATILIKSPKIDFRESDGVDLISGVTERLMSRKKDLGIADVRDVSQPFGSTNPEAAPDDESFIERLARQRITRERAVHYYVSNDDADAGKVTRLDVILADDPFSRESIAMLGRIEQAVREALPKELAGADVETIGPTASMRDLKIVADKDRARINLLVVVVVFVVLNLLRIGIGLTVYLLFTVLFSFLSSLGVTDAVFRLRDPVHFHGLDWTVPLFLFTILVAVGIDYNILLVSRIKEESRRSGPIRGIIDALARTGVIISSCGIIMGGTFLSLLVGGRLSSMSELGFALAFGVFLDTFVVRPFLVPSFLILVRSGRLGFGRRSAASNTPAPAVRDENRKLPSRSV